jgi:two-component system, sensor histidine kinase and response regulator
MLVRESTSSAEQLEYARMLETTASGTFNMLDNLLEWETLRSETPVHLESVSVERLFSDVLPFQQAYAHSKGIRVITDIVPDLAFLGDVVSVAAVLRNIIGNGIKFSREGSTVAVTVEPDPAGKSIVFSVRDSGDGSPPEVATTIRSGRPMSGSRGTLSEPITGLGLAVCTRLLE